jgi:hypothetical protein
MEAQSGRGSCRASILAVQGVLNAPAGAEKHVERAFRHRSYRNVRAKRELLFPNPSGALTAPLACD